MQKTTDARKGRIDYGYLFAEMANRLRKKVYWATTEWSKAPFAKIIKSLDSRGRLGKIMALLGLFRRTEAHVPVERGQEVRYR